LSSNIAGRRRSLVAPLVLALLGLGGVATVGSSAAVRNEQPSAVKRDEVEKPAKVTAVDDDHTEIIDNGNGTKTAKITSGPSSFVRNGKRQKIDVSLRPNGGRLVADGLPAPVSVAAVGDADELVMFGEPGKRVRLKRPNSSGLDAATSSRGVSVSDAPGAVRLAPSPAIAGVPICLTPPLAPGGLAVVVPDNPVCAQSAAPQPLAPAPTAAGGVSVAKVPPQGDDGEPIIRDEAKVREGVRDGERAKRTRRVRAKQGKNDRGDDSSAEFDGVFGVGSRLKYDISTNGVKESIVLSAAPVGEAVFRFPLELDGLTVRADGRDGFEFVSSDGIVAYQIPAAFAFDSRGGVDVPTNEHVGVPMELVGDATVGLTLVVRPPTAWLHANDRVYPVTIDPTFTFPAWNGMNIGTQPAGDPLRPAVNGGFHPIAFQAPLFDNYGKGESITSKNFTVVGSQIVGGLPSFTKASAVLLTVVSYSADKGSYLSIHPTGRATDTSVLNVRPWGQERSQIAVALGDGGQFTIDSGEAPSKWLWVQVNGWYDEGLVSSGGYRYVPSNGYRLVSPTGPYSLAANPTGPSSTRVQVGGQQGIPLGIKAVTVNITTYTPTQGWGSLDVVSNEYGGYANLGWTQPGTTYRGRTATLFVGPNGAIDVRGWGNNVPVALYVDVEGWYVDATSTQGYLYQPVNPFRVKDSRPVSATEYTFNVAPKNANVKAVSLSVVGINSTPNLNFELVIGRVRVRPKHRRCAGECQWRCHVEVCAVGTGHC
jgi:hypothetical protein